MIKKGDVDTWLGALRHRPLPTVLTIAVLLLALLAWRYATSFVDRLSERREVPEVSATDSSMDLAATTQSAQDSPPEEREPASTHAPASTTSPHPDSGGSASPPFSPPDEFVQATGTGFPPPNIPEPGRRRALARRAAEVVALRRLGEQLEGALIESKSSAEMAALTEDQIEVRVKSLVRLARVVDERVNPDGSVEVTMEAPVQQAH